MAPARGEWSASPGIGWQFGEIPDAPDGLCAAANAAWTVWMRSWVAAHWAPEDVPGLRVTVQLLDQVERYMADPYIEKETRKGDTMFVLRPNPAGELRQMMDNYGITKKGQQDRRWTAPEADAEPVTTPSTAPTGRYGHLRVAG